MNIKDDIIRTVDVNEGLLDSLKKVLTVETDTIEEQLKTFTLKDYMDVTSALNTNNIALLEQKFKITTDSGDEHEVNVTNPNKAQVTTKSPAQPAKTTKTDINPMQIIPSLMQQAKSKGQT